jgi:hypothetical protein
MNCHLKSILEQKQFLEAKLKKICVKSKKQNKKKLERCEPIAQNTFLLKNKKNDKMNSTLIQKGMIRPGSKTKKYCSSHQTSKRNTYFKKNKRQNNQSRSKSMSRSIRMSRPSSKEFTMTGTKRNKFNQIRPGGFITVDARNKMIEKEKMSKLFTKDRRNLAKKDFKERVQYNLQKKVIKSKQLEEKLYNYDFQPAINKSRINLKPKKLHKNVYSRVSNKNDQTLKKIISNKSLKDNILELRNNLTKLQKERVNSKGDLSSQYYHPSDYIHLSVKSNEFNLNSNTNSVKLLGQGHKGNSHLSQKIQGSSPLYQNNKQTLPDIDSTDNIFHQSSHSNDISLKDSMVLNC